MIPLEFNICDCRAPKVHLTNNLSKIRLALKCQIHHTVSPNSKIRLNQDFITLVPERVRGLRTHRCLGRRAMPSPNEKKLTWA